MNKRHPYRDMEREYNITAHSLRELCRRHNITAHSLITVQAKKRKWAEKREQYQAKADEAHMSRHAAHQADRLAEIHDKAIDVIDEALDRFRDHMRATESKRIDGEWVEVTAGANGPDITVAIGWDGRKVQPTRGHGASLPYVGILASHTTEKGKALEAAVRPLAERELVASKTYRRGTYWIVYRFIEASDDWYRDVAGWRSSMVAELLRAWRDGAALIEEGSASLS